MITMYEYAAMTVPAVAVALDLYFGDPEGFPHPVRYVGDLITRVEGFIAGMGNGRLLGALGALVVVLCTAAVVYILTSIPFLGLLAALYFSFAGLALGSLLRESDRVIRLISSGNLADARRDLGYLVSRDTKELDEQGVLRTLAETMSENLNDAFVAPFSFLAVFGPTGLWVYKAVSTLDSMWGYKTPRYKDMGWFSAKADDVLAFIPARLTALAMIGAGAVLGYDWRSAYANILADASKTESPNAGWPMAAAAWLVGGRMGGPAVYFGELKDKPTFGPDDSWSLEKIKRLRKLILASGLLAALCLFLYFVMVKVSSAR